MHYEVELGLIMGKTVRDLDPEDTKGAMDAIEGMFFLVCSKSLLQSHQIHETYT
jgi:2-keto-4-pentenoate hydratase/2-oxohepta-3-ene-1,7-dioic acid hydratase in catechol pathway